MNNNVTDPYESILEEMYDLMLPEAPSLTDTPEKRHPPSPELFDLILWNLILAPLAGVFFAELWSRIKSRSQRRMIEEKDVLEVRHQVEQLDVELMEQNSDRITEETGDLLRSFGIGQSKSIRLSRQITEIRVKHIRRNETSSDA